MNVWDPYNPVVYILHTVLGTTGVVAAVVALTSQKGSTLHVRAGIVSTAFAVVASVTAIIFSATQFSPFAVVSAVMVISLVAGAILAVRPRATFVRVGEGVTTALIAFAFAITVHAPVVSFGDDLGIHPVLAFFGPSVLWPMLVFLFRAHPLLTPKNSVTAV